MGAVLGAVPIVQAPMAGEVATPALAAAVSGAGGLGFLAAGYKSPDTVRREITEVRRLTIAPFGVNVFVPGTDPVDLVAVARFCDRIMPASARRRSKLAEITTDDDWMAKLELLLADPASVVSFTFGCPPTEVITDLRVAGSSVVITVTPPDEAEHAARAGADALCVQGIEAGGHRTSFTNDDGPDYGLLLLLRLIAERVELPLIAAGGIMRARDVRDVLAAGAVAAQSGTAFLRCPEAGTHPAHRAALTDPRFVDTAITRAFTGRRARALVNRFLTEHSVAAPREYPYLHHLTKDIRKAAALAGNVDPMALRAGLRSRLAEDIPATKVVRRLAAGVL